MDNDYGWFTGEAAMCTEMEVRIKGVQLVYWGVYGLGLNQ